MKNKPEFQIPNFKFRISNFKFQIFKRFGILFRLILVAVMLISATTFTLGYIGVGIIHQFVLSRFEERMAFLAKYLALNSELGILIDERTMLTRLAQNLLSEKDVVRVVICNDIGETLADVSKDSNLSLPLSYFSFIEVPVNLKESHDESLAFQLDGNEKTQEELIGRVQITYSTEGITMLLSAIKSRFIWLSIGLAAICVLFFYLISRSVVSPLTQLVQATRRVEKGELQLRVMPSNLPEIRELAISFNEMLASLEKGRKKLEDAHQKMLRQKTLAEIGKFSLMIAHEVKNPLSIIKSSLDILKKGIEQPSGNMMIAYIEDEIRRLNRLIEDFLLFAKPAVPVFRSIDVNALLSERLPHYFIKIGQADNKHVNIEINIPNQPCYIRADSDLLMRAIDNIVKNAIEANEGRGRVRITAFYNNGESDEKEKYWVLEIADEGYGIAPENINKIFEPFFTTRSKGTGLGLAFASQIIIAHEGKITAQNREIRGALFQVEIPVKN